MAIDNKDKKVLKSSIEREQNEVACSAECEKIKGSKNLNVPHLRFPEFSGEWEMVSLQDIATINPKSDPLQNTFIYIDLEAVEKGELRKIQEIMREEAPSRAQRVIDNNDILFQCVRPYQKNNYIHRILNTSNQQWVASTGYAQIRTTELPNYIYHLLNTDEFNRKVMVRCTGSSYPAINSEDLATIHLYYTPDKKEQLKISRLLDLLDKRIATQNKIIEDLNKLKSAIIEMEYTHKTKGNTHIGDFIEQTSKRNKDSAIQNVLSVSNSQGFIQQCEQFENRSVASDDISNYKIVERNCFAFNPARINVGSIARLTTFNRGIVSPMYICFRTKDNLFPEYLDYYFESKQFFTEIQKRLEGSVRQCLSYEGLCNIPLCIPTVEVQQQTGKRLSTLVQEIKLEIDFLELLQKQKKFLLHQMFI